ncbi:MAG: hypothetical protein CL610_08090 [Anaerolineaceae bacterium]|nr:hypothetical protein [Anaerolineaceae bacterium]
MIIDSHCHAWAYWPYQPAVPDLESRGTAAQLAFEMKLNGVDHALIVCAEIDHNPDNNAYVAGQVRQNEDTFSFVVDVDSKWKASYHTPGAADRLQEAINRWHPAGFTHYLADEADAGDWFLSDEGLAFLECAHAHHLLASIHCRPQHQSAIRQVARQFPALRFLIHHMGHPPVLEPEGLSEVLQTAACDNVFIKVSGFYYGTASPRWDYPLVDMQPTVRALVQRYGASRLCWGSDYPVVRQWFNYRHALEIVRTHCRFIAADDMDLIMGDTLAGLLRG